MKFRIKHLIFTFILTQSNLVYANVCKQQQEWLLNNLSHVTSQVKESNNKYNEICSEGVLEQALEVKTDGRHDVHNKMHESFSDIIMELSLLRSLISYDHRFDSLDRFIEEAIYLNNRCSPDDYAPYLIISTLKKSVDLIIKLHKNINYFQLCEDEIYYKYNAYQE